MPETALIDRCSPLVRPTLTQAAELERRLVAELGEMEAFLGRG
jgi:hypothetical protein